MEVFIITRNIVNSASAFISSDVTLRDKRNQPLQFSLALDTNVLNMSTHVGRSRRTTPMVKRSLTAGLTPTQHTTMSRILSIF